MAGKFKMVLSLILATLVVTTLLAGCGTADQASTAADASQAAASSVPADTAAKAPDTEKATVSMASWAQRGDTADSDWISVFEKENPNTKIDYIAVTEGDYSQKLNAMIAAKSAPDIILAWECDIARFVKSGAIISLDDYVKNTTAFKLDDFVPAVSQLGSLTGGTYGLPWCMAAEILYYNKDMFDKAGVPYPANDWTTQQFEDAAKKLTIVQNGKTVQWGMDAISFPGIWYGMFGSAGDNVVDSNGKLTLGDKAVKALQWQADLTNKYKVSPPPAASGSNAVDLFSAGKAAMTRAGNWMIQTYRPITDFKWDIAPIPQDERQYTNLHTGLFCINSESKVKDAAWKFIEFSMGDEGQELICKMGTNPSARKSITAKGFYRAGGANGPTNWDALDASIGFAQFGYVLANPGVAGGTAVNYFNSVMMGQMDAATAIKKANEDADKAAAQ